MGRATMAPACASHHSIHQEIHGIAAVFLFDRCYTLCFASPAMRDLDIRSAGNGAANKAHFALPQAGDACEGSHVPHILRGAYMCEAVHIPGFIVLSVSFLEAKGRTCGSNGRAHACIVPHPCFFSSRKKWRAALCNPCRLRMGCCRIKSSSQAAAAINRHSISNSHRRTAARIHQVASHMGSCS